MTEKIFDLIIVGDSCYRGGPTLFAKMRRALALAADIPLAHLIVDLPDSDEVVLEVPDLDGFDLVEKNIYGEWDAPPSDPILHLLAHSDEKGEIKEEHMLSLVARITELEPIAYDIINERDGLEAAQIISHRLQWFAEQLAMAYTTHRPVNFRLEPQFP